MVAIPPSTLSGLLQDTWLHKGPTHIFIVEVSFPYPLIYLEKLTSTQI